MSASDWDLKDSAPVPSAPPHGGADWIRRTADLVDAVATVLPTARRRHTR